MMRYLSALWQGRGRGDTIVEVLIGITILSVVLGAAYAASSNSLQQGAAAGNRGQALGYAEQQISLIKSAAATDQSLLSQYMINQPFCILEDGSVDTDSVDTSAGVCKLDNQAPYGVGIKYSSSSQVFTVTAKWPGNNASGEDQLILYYKVGSGS
jgi:type II secretory pathway pseudopilin PulG